MSRPRRVRTVFYGDQVLYPSELELLHTPALQRLYDLHQLGLTDRVFIDASHSRLHHVVGVMGQADKLINAIANNLKREAAAGTRQALQVGPLNNMRSLSILDLAKSVERHRAAARLMGLLHDLTHAPFGHTLEDEIELVDEKHDEPRRQAHAFYCLLCQLIGWLAVENPPPAGSPIPGLPPDTAAKRPMPGFKTPLLYHHLPDTLSAYLLRPDTSAPPPVSDVVPVAHYLLTTEMRPQRVAHDFGSTALAQLLRDLHLAMNTLLRLELLHKDADRVKKAHFPRPDPYDFDNLIVQSLAAANLQLNPDDHFDHHRHAYLIDIIGNTVCADLLDYAQRDAHFANIKTAYDPDRIIEHFTLVAIHFPARAFTDPPIQRTPDPFTGRVLRPAIALFTDKLRTDVVSGVMDLLHARFDLYERAVYHPTKCIAGSMLGRALQLIGLDLLPPHMLFIGDHVFLAQIADAAWHARHLLTDVLRHSAPDQRITDDTLKRLSRYLDHMPSTGTIQVVRQLLLQHKGKSRLHACAAIDGGMHLLNSLLARRYHRVVFRLRPDNTVCEHRRSQDHEKTYTELVAGFFQDARHRQAAEEAIEREADLPPGSVVIHCPRYAGPTKLTEVLLLARTEHGDGDCQQLRNARTLQESIFEHHVEAVAALERMYQSTWRLLVSIGSPYFCRWDTIQTTIATVLRRHIVDDNIFWPTAPELANDPTLVAEMVLATKRASEVEAAAPVLSTSMISVDESRPLTADELESLILWYGIRREDRMRLTRIIIPQFLRRVTNEVPADHIPRLAQMLLARQPQHEFCYNRTSAAEIQEGLDELLAEYHREAHGG